MDFSTLVAAVQDNCDRLNIATAETTNIKRWINQTIREDICGEHNWPFMEDEVVLDTAAGVAFYPFPGPDTFKDCRFIYFRKEATDEWQELTETSERALYQRLTSVEQGRPRAWVPVHRNGVYGFIVREVPDTAGWNFRLGFWRYFDALVEDEDHNQITDTYSKLVEVGATRRGLLQFSELEQYQFWSGLWRDEFDKMLRVERAKDKPASMTLRMSGAAGRPAAGLPRWSRNWHSAYSWLN